MEKRPVLGTILIIFGLGVIGLGIHLLLFGIEILFWLTVISFGLALIVSGVSAIKGKSIMKIIDDLLITLP